MELKEVNAPRRCGQCCNKPWSNLYMAQFSTTLYFAVGLDGFLKGADAVVLAAANHLKLKTALHPIWQGEDSDDVEVIGDRFEFHLSSIYDEDFNERLQEEVTAPHLPKDITWCTNDRRAWAEDHTVASYGNEPSTTTVYCAAAILIHIPAWSERHPPSA